MIAKYAVLIIYFAILFGIGIVASRRISTLKDYYLGGKNLGTGLQLFQPEQQENRVGLYWV